MGVSGGRKSYHIIMAVHIKDIDDLQVDFQTGTLTDVEADAGGFLRLADTDVLSFDGVDDYVACGDISFYGQDFTFECWFKLNTIPASGSTDYRLSICRHTGTNWSPGVWLHGGLIRCHAQTGSGGLYHDYSWSADTNWHHLSYSYDSSTDTILIYFDGTNVSTTSTTFLDASGAGTLYLGDEGANTSHSFNGIIDDVRIWNTVRTQQQIQDNMNKRLTGTETGLVAYYKLDEGTGTVATDSTGTNDGTINGATWVANEPLYFMNSTEDNNRISPPARPFRCRNG